MYTLFWRVPGVHVYGAKNQINVPVGATVSDKASIRFTGKGAANTGKIQQENLMRLTENFAGPTPPAYATTGQTWYDTLSNQLKVCVSNSPQPEVWVAAGGGIQTSGPSDPPPENPKPGDLWMQTTGSGSSVLYVFSGTGRYPETTAGIGGWEQVYPTVELHAGREEFESMMALLEQLIGPASTRGSGAVGRSVTSLPDIGKLDRSMREAWTTAAPSDPSKLIGISGEPYVPFQASSRNQLAIKTNYSDFNTRDYNELYICGFNSTSIAMEDIDGKIYVGNVLVNVPRGSCFTSNVFADGLIVWDTTSTLTSAVGPSKFFIVRKNGASWQYDQGAVVGSWTNFTPQLGMFAIGTATTVAIDSNSAPGIVSANAWDNAVELLNSSISALKIEPNSNDWDQLLAAAKYALNRLDFPASMVDDISPMPFVNDGRPPASNLVALSPSDPRFPSQERRSSRHYGGITLNRMFTETANVLNAGVNSRYVLGGMLGTSGTKSTFGPSVTVDLQASVQANAGASGGVFGQATRTTGIVMRFNNRDELERFFYAGQALQLRVTHTPGTNTAADLNLKGLTDGYGLVRLLADRSLTMVSTGTPALNAPITNVGGVELGASPSVISSSTNGTSTLQVTAKALSDTVIQLDLFVLAGGVTSGTFTAEWSVVNDNETWAGGRVYPGVLPYAAGTDFVAGNFTDSTPISPLTIQTQPQALTVNNGQTATFGVVASGAGPISYQWRKNGVNIPGAVSSSYSFSTVTGDNGAVFSVIVTNPYSTLTSNNATLTVTTVVAPTISMVPASTVLAANGGSIGTYTGSPTTITATKNGVPITVGGEIIVSGGQVSLTSGVGLSSNGAVYSVTVSNAGGSATGSTTVTVTPRTFTLQQNNPAWVAGQNLNMRLAQELSSDAGIFNTAITSGSLPSGVSLAGNFGFITGAPASSGPYSFTVTYTPYSDQTNVSTRVLSYSGSVDASYSPPYIAATAPFPSSVTSLWAGQSININAISGSLPATLIIKTNNVVTTNSNLNASSQQQVPIGPFGLSMSGTQYEATLTDTSNSSVGQGPWVTTVNPQNLNAWVENTGALFNGSAPKTFSNISPMINNGIGDPQTAPLSGSSVVSGSLPPGLSYSHPYLNGTVSTPGTWSATFRLVPVADRCSVSFKDITVTWTYT